MSVKTILIAHRTRPCATGSPRRWPTRVTPIVLVGLGGRAPRRPLERPGAADEPGARRPRPGRGRRRARQRAAAAARAAPCRSWCSPASLASGEPGAGAGGDERRGYINEHAETPQILPALAPHLFPDNFNRRASPRVPLGVPVSYRAGQTIAGAVTLDVGTGGLAIRTMNPLPEGHGAPAHVPAARDASRDRRVTAASPGAIARSAWACSSRRSRRTTSARSTRSSTRIRRSAARQVAGSQP